MSKIDKSFWVVVCVLTGLLFFPMALPTSFKIDEAKSPVFASFPFKLGEWRGTDTPLDERTFEILETRNVLSRFYENQRGNKIHLLLVGSHKDRRVAHPPEVCYLSSNYVIVNESQNRLKIDNQEILTKEFIAKSERDPSHQEEVLYLYKVGNQFTTNYYAQQLQFAWDRLTRQDSEVLLIRLSGTDKQLFREFLEQALAHLKV